MAVKIMTSEEEPVRNMVGDLPEIELVLDNKIGKGQYNITLGELAINGTDKQVLQEILALSSALREAPAELRDIINELSIRKDDTIADLKSGAYSFAVVFTDDIEAIKSLKGIEKVSHMKFLLSSSKQMAESLGLQFPGALAYSATDKNILNLPFQGNLDALVAAVSLPALSPINSESFKYFQALDQKLFYMIDKAGTFEKNRRRFGEGAKQCSSFSKFIFFTPEDVPALIPLLKVQESDYPLLVSLATEGKGIVRSLREETFMQSVQSLITMTAERVIFSSRIPEDNEKRPVKVVSTDTLEKFTEAKDKDVMIAFTSPTCKYCEMLHPVLERLGTVLLERGVPIVVGDYNIMENEEATKFKIAGVPTIYFIKKGATAPSMVPADARTLDKLLKYISEEGVSANIKLEDFSKEINAENERKEEDKIDSEVEEAVEAPAEEKMQRETL